MKKRIAFIYLDDILMIYHFIGIVAELAKRTEKYDIEILTYKGEHKVLYRLCDMLGIDKDCVKQLNTKLYRRVREWFGKRKFPQSTYLIKKQTKFMLTYDALVFTDKKHEIVYENRKNGIPKLIYIRHGAGQRLYPFVLESITMFDLILTSSKMVIELYKKYFDYPHTVFNVIGYPKLDVAKLGVNNKSLFNNSKLTIIYNPHFRRVFSSWFKYGTQILDLFYNNKDYNLIFAPHVHLLNKETTDFQKTIVNKYYEAENILIDLGSTKSTDMTYTMNSDLYLGDVSSQVYEFLLYKQRPCIFIVPEDVNETSPNFGQVFPLGQTITNIDNLKELIDSREEWQKNYVSQQVEIVQNTFDIDQEISSSKRAADAIIDFLDT